MVAEKSIVCRSSGSIARIFSTSSRKPRSSIRSASSRTSACTRSSRRCFCFGQVQQPAGRADEDLDALAQRLDLRLVRHAAVDRQHPYAAGRAGGGEVLGDLDAQLAGGDDDQRLRHAVAALARGEDPLQQRYAEAEGLAGAGGRLADQVGAAQRDRQRVLLDGEGAGDADGGERLDGLAAGAELGEGRVPAARGNDGVRVRLDDGGRSGSASRVRRSDRSCDCGGALSWCAPAVRRARSVWRGPHGRTAIADVGPGRTRAAGRAFDESAAHGNCAHPTRAGIGAGVVWARAGGSRGRARSVARNTVTDRGDSGADPTATGTSRSATHRRDRPRRDRPAARTDGSADGEPTARGDGLGDLHVGELADRHDDPPALLVGQASSAALARRAPRSRSARSRPATARSPGPARAARTARRS